MKGLEIGRSDVSIFGNKNPGACVHVKRTMLMLMMMLMLARVSEPGRAEQSSSSRARHKYYQWLSHSLRCEHHIRFTGGGGGFMLGSRIEMDGFSLRDATASGIIKICASRDSPMRSGMGSVERS